MIQVVEKRKCCGCTACYSICTRNAIEMIPDEEGFLYPNIDTDLCINCGKCEQICPVLNKIVLPPKSISAYVVQNDDDTVLRQSTSGGFVDALLMHIILGGGYGSGCMFNDSWLPEHNLTNNINDIAKFRGSKYAQSDLKKSFREIKRLIDEGADVCFVGTPCQVAGLKKYIGKGRQSLITVDIVCRSVPSPMLFAQYLDYQKKRKQSDILALNCREKTYGYHSGSLRIKFTNGESYSGSNRVDPYMKAFHANICSRPSCYDCQFKTRTRCSDFTVFDCWSAAVKDGMLDDNDKGYTNVVCHTEKAESIIHAISGIEVVKADLGSIFYNTGEMESKSVLCPKERENFYLELRLLGFERTMKKYLRITLTDKAIEKLKPMREVLRKIYSRRNWKRSKT